MDLRDAPAREFEAIRQRVKAMPSYMVVMQHDEDSFKQDSNWETSLGFWTNLPGLIQSFAEPGEEIHVHYKSATHVAKASVESAIARFQRTGSARRWVGTFFTAWQAHLSGSLAKGGRKKAERIDQQLQDKLCQVFQSEAAILRAMRTGCCESTSLRWPGVTGRKHWHLNLRRCSSRDKWDWMSRRTTKPRQHEHCRKWKKRELLRQHRNLGHPQPTESARALRHAGTRREATRLVLRNCVVQHAKLDHCHSHHVQACCHAV